MKLENLHLLAETLRIKLPITQRELKMAFRYMSRQTHPDHGGNEADFIKVKEAYDVLSNSDVFTEGEVSFGTTVEGIPLSDLGQGLGPLKNGVSCDFCDGKGYHTRIEQEQSYKTCPSCVGNGYSIIPCRRCRQGKFKLRNGREVDCRVCRGTGIFKSLRGNLCFTCFGSGTVGTTTGVERKIHSRCYSCKGIGEKEVWNPVIPKGRLF